MGNDGGSIPTRRELVKEAAKNPTTAQLKETQQEQQLWAWTYDPITRKRLAAPVVADATGRLYNKDTILELLVGGESEKKTKGVVTSLRDVVEVKFEGDGEGGWNCPVTGAKLGPGTKAVYIVPCGHAFSGVAIKEVAGERCVTCDGEYAAEDVIPILSTGEADVTRLVSRRQALKDKGVTHSLKKAPGGEKSKKRKKREASPEKPSQAAITKSGDPDVDNKASGNSARAERAEHSRINNAATATLTAKVMQEQEVAKKRRLDNKNVASLFSNRDGEAHHGQSADFMTRGFAHIPLRNPASFESASKDGRTSSAQPHLGESMPTFSPGGGPRAMRSLSTARTAGLPTPRQSAVLIYENQKAKPLNAQAESRSWQRSGVVFASAATGSHWARDNECKTRFEKR
ncbi:Replication termination factor 2, partial [Oleoguttula sp. CCFEE 5521]